MEMIDTIIDSLSEVMSSTVARNSLLWLGVFSLLVSIHWFFKEKKHEPILALFTSLAFFAGFFYSEAKEKEGKKDVKIEIKEYIINNKITNNSIGGIVLGMTMQDVLIMYNSKNGYLIRNYDGEKGTCFNSFVTIVDKSTNEDIITIQSYDNWNTIAMLSTESKRYHTEHGLYPKMPISEYLEIYPDGENLYQNEMDDEEYFAPFNLNNKNYSFDLYVLGNKVSETTEYGKIEGKYFKKIGENYLVANRIGDFKQTIEDEDLGDFTNSYSKNGHIYKIQVSINKREYDKKAGSRGYVPQ